VSEHEPDEQDGTATPKEPEEQSAESSEPGQAVLDSSAVLAVLYNEPGAEVARPYLDGGIISAVNFTEVLTKIRARSTTSAEADDAPTVFAGLGLHVAERFIAWQAARAAAMQSAAGHLGVSLGDRACLAVTETTPGGYALTADTAWRKLPTDLDTAERECDQRVYSRRSQLKLTVPA
jgi:PIN domain nuclease of toxin-antitoxin system